MLARRACSTSGSKTGSMHGEPGGDGIDTEDVDDADDAGPEFGNESPPADRTTICFRIVSVSLRIRKSRSGRLRAPVSRSFHAAHLP